MGSQRQVQAGICPRKGKEPKDFLTKPKNYQMELLKS